MVRCPTIYQTQNRPVPLLTRFKRQSYIHVRRYTITCHIAALSSRTQAFVACSAVSPTGRTRATFRSKTTIAHPITATFREAEARTIETRPTFARSVRVSKPHIFRAQRAVAHSTLCPEYQELDYVSLLCHALLEKEPRLYESGQASGK